MTGDVPLELLKVAVLLRRLVFSDASTSKLLESNRDDVSTSESLESDRDDLSTQELIKSHCEEVSTSESLEFNRDYLPTQELLESDRIDVSTKNLLKSLRDVDQKVLILLASVCRHWRTTIKTRSNLSRQQLCLMLHG